MPDDNHHTDDHKRSTPAADKPPGIRKNHNETPATQKTGAGRSLASTIQFSNHGPAPTRPHPGKPRGQAGGTGCTTHGRGPGTQKHVPCHPPQGTTPRGDTSHHPFRSQRCTRPPAHKGRRHRRAIEKRKLHRKEVIQPHLPVRLPCYDLVPITSLTLDGSPHKGQATGFGCCPLS